MLFKIPTVLATLGLLGLVTASPIVDGNNDAGALLKRATGGNGGSSSGSSGGNGNGASTDHNYTGGDPGPSGELLLPRGGDVLYTEVDWPGAGFHFVYKPVYLRNPDPNCVNQRQACYAATSWLHVSLVSLDVPGTEYTLADFLHTDLDNPSVNIDTWLGIPEEADCGNWRVRVIEHQRYFNRWVEFQSAAPQVSMQCVRYAGPTRA